MELIASYTAPSGGLANFTFSEIPGTYTDLLMIGSLRFARSARDTPIKITFNGSDFTGKNLYGFPPDFGSQNPTNYVGWTNASTSLANTFGNFTMYIPNYASSGNKSFSVDAVMEDSQDASFVTITSGQTITTTPIVTLVVSDQSASGNALEFSSVELYGITAGTDGIVTVS